MSIKLPEPKANEVTQVVTNLSFMWNADMTQATITLRDIGRAQMDAYVALVNEALLKWPYGQRVMLVHDLNMANVTLTPYAREKFEEAFTAPLKSPRTGRIVAFLHPMGGRGILTIAQNAFARRGTIVQRVFTRPEEIVPWLTAE